MKYLRNCSAEESGSAVIRIIELSGDFVNRFHWRWRGVFEEEDEGFEDEEDEEDCFDEEEWLDFLWGGGMG